MATGVRKRSERKVRRAQAPAVVKRKLRNALREGREAAGLTQKEAATALYWSPSKIIRIELGTVPVTIVDLRALLAEYKIVDPERLAELEGWAKVARESEPFDAFRDVYSAESLSLFNSEPYAWSILKYEPTLIPGLLQTEDYASGIFKALHTREDQVDRKLEARRKRQDLLESEDCPDLHFIIGEAALARPVGGRDLMLAQLDQLKRLSRRDNVTLQVLPFAKGPHEGMGSAFTILDFDDPEVPNLLYQEGADRETLVKDDDDLISRFTSRFYDLSELADPPAEFESSVDQVLARHYS